MMKLKAESSHLRQGFGGQAKPKVILLLFTLCFLLSTCLGCEAFRRKFVRKAKEKEVKVVIHTQEYESKYSIEETYKKYFLFWSTAHEELINSLNVQDGNRKKRIFAAKKVIENLQYMRQLLLLEKQVGLDTFISKLESILSQLDTYKLRRAQSLRIKSILEKQRRKIQREFSFRHIQEYLIKR